MDLYAVLSTAIAAAHEAIEVHRAEVGLVSADAWAEKGTHDFVTRVDHDAESRIIERIRADFPDHRFLAEEQATASADGDDGSNTDSSAGLVTPGTAAVPRLREMLLEPGWIWVIDPLDGTTNYLHRYPAYAASVAALFDGEPVAAAIVHGVTGETWTALRGGGAFQDGVPIRVSGTESLGHALIGTGFPFKALHLLPLYVEQFQRVLRHAAGVRRAGSAALDLCHLASGYFDGFWELWLAPWDVAAGTLIVREAGGVVTRVDGDPDIADFGSLLAGNPSVHAGLAGLLESERD